MNLDTFLKSQEQFLPIEQLFRTLYKKYPDRNLNLPNTITNCQDILDQASHLMGFPLIEKLRQNSLSENLFFGKEFDVELYKHLRYLPAYWHSHTFLEVVCVFQGTCINYISDQDLKMQAGDICIIAPQTTHAISAFSDECIILNIELRTSTFETAFFGTLDGNDILSEFFAHTLYHSPSHPYIYFKTNGDKALFDYVLYAYGEAQGKRQYKNRMLNNVITAFFIMLLRNHGSGVILPDQSISDTSENVILLLKYIQEHYNTISLSELAEFFNYSERQIQRLLKNYTGMSFRENIQKLKMKQASRLLVNSKLSVSAIAAELGYSNVGNFRTIFKKYYGLTPFEYRMNSADHL